MGGDYFFQAGTLDVFFHSSAILDIDQIFSPEMMINIAIGDVNTQSSNVTRKVDLY